MQGALGARPEAIHCNLHRPVLKSSTGPAHLPPLLVSDLDGRITVIQRWSGACSAQHKESLETLFLSKRLQELHASPLFAGLSPSEIVALASAGFISRVYRREFLYNEGEPVSHIFMVASGRMKTTLLRENGAEMILRFSGPGDIVGEFGDTSDKVYGSSAQAMEVSDLLIWKTDVFGTLLERFPLLRRNQVAILSHRLREMDCRFCEISSDPVATRLANTLARLSRHIGRPVSEGIEIALSQLELAQLIGATPSTISRLLSDWERQGFVRGRREALLLRCIDNLQSAVNLGSSS
jgi:CRP-like cAMP-binding protein